MRVQRARGFTLIELMVVIGVAAILLTIALPSFLQSLRSNRVASTANITLATLSYARSEAIRSRAMAGVCPKGSDNASCGTDWNQGMLIWTDDDRNKAFDKNEVKRVVEPNRGIVMSADSGVSELAFDSRGRSIASTSRTLSLQPDACAKGVKNVRTITITAIGQIAMQKGNCP